LRGEEELDTALASWDANAPEQLQLVLRRAAHRIRDSERVAKLQELCRELERMPEAYRDYRVRLRELGWDTHGLRGLGAIESNVNRFEGRLEKRGQSWGLTGLKCMLSSLIQRYEGKLAAYAEHVGRIRHLVSEERLQAGAGHLVKQAVSVATGAKHAHPPVLDAGRTRSGGMSRVIRSLNRSALAVT